MGFLSKLLKKEERSTAHVPQNEDGLIKRWEIPAEKIDRMQRIEASEEYRESIYRSFYSDYPEKPFVSQDREFNTSWIEQALQFPDQSLVSPDKMVRYKDGLLPGHVYMMHWIQKYKSGRRIPAYFEYDYGIEFMKEREFLKEHKYLDEDYKVTALGKDAMQQHFDVIEKRHPKPSYTSKTPVGFANTGQSARSIPVDIVPGTIDIPDSDLNLIKKELEVVNSLVSEAVKLAHLNVSLKIDYSSLLFGDNFTYYECDPYTKTGRASKYPLILHYAYCDHNKPAPPQDYFGELKYLNNGQIGAARLIFWDRNRGHLITLGTVKNVLAIKKVEKSMPNGAGWKVVYKLES
ncbi:MAG: hypothetical protein SOR41_05190 [Eubacteriales bacterium]|nr:hypothetical protein [Eubacteriales bacterium]